MHIECIFLEHWYRPFLHIQYILTKNLHLDEIHSYSERPEKTEKY